MLCSELLSVPCPRMPALQPPPSLANYLSWVPWAASLTSWVALWLTFSLSGSMLTVKESLPFSVFPWCKALSVETEMPQSWLEASETPGICTCPEERKV